MLIEIIIKFPKLGINISNIVSSIKVLGVNISVFSLFVLLGIVVGSAFIFIDSRKSWEMIDIYRELIICAVLIGIIGGRTVYVLSNFTYYKNNFLQIFNIRNGDVSFWGALIAAIVSCLVFSIVKKEGVFRILDTCCVGLTLGQIVCCIGNVFAGTGYGGYTNSLFAMQIKYSYAKDFIEQDVLDNVTLYDGTQFIQVTPVFLYKMFAFLILFIILFGINEYKKYKKIEKYNGINFGIYIISMIMITIAVNYI